MPTPRQTLAKYNILPLKRYGQSFLIDRNIIERIVANAEIDRNDEVVEIGAGAGIMTAMLSECAWKVRALEIDGRMIDVLKEELKARRNVTVLHQDVLTYDFTVAAHESREGRLIVVGNIPYNISSQIMFRLIQQRDVISKVVLMFQKEVAERIIALPGMRQYGSLSVLTSMYMSCSKVMTVSPTCFYPKPRVDSMVLKMRARERPLTDVKDPELFHKVVRAAFSKRRKTLVNSLKSNPFLSLEHDEIVKLTGQACIDPTRRAETLTVEEFGRLTNVLFGLRTGG